VETARDLNWIAAYGPAGIRSGLIRIPVVVHVLWHTAAENISNAQIQSQIDVLNEDFRRLNADAATTPAAFAAVSADARLEFALAVLGPGCTATNGITRHNTSVTGWTYPGNGMKSAATGGADPWDSGQYLNIWIVNYTDDTLGFGTFPGGPRLLMGLSLSTRPPAVSGPPYRVRTLVEPPHTRSVIGSTCITSGVMMDLSAPAVISLLIRQIKQVHRPLIAPAVDSFHVSPVQMVRMETCS
jgi:hypothetical protein